MKKSDSSLDNGGGNSLASHLTLFEGLDCKPDLTRVDADVR